MYVCLEKNASVFAVQKSKHENPIAEQSRVYFQAPPKHLVEENMTLQSTVVAGLWKLWNILSITEIKAMYFFVTRFITLHNCLHKEPQLIYHLICYLVACYYHQKCL